MRIISGKFGGRKLASFQADHIRPTTDRIKGSVFNRLADRIERARVLDLFSGTGNLGLEAASRGAEVVVAVESHRKSQDIIRSNLKLLGIEDGFEIVGQDVFTYLSSYQGQPFDIILVDPPFTQAIAHKVMGTLAVSRVWGSETVIIIEAAARESLEEVYGELRARDIRGYGDKKVGFFTCRPTSPPIEP